MFPNIFRLCLRLVINKVVKEKEYSERGECKTRCGGPTFIIVHKKNV